jgi:hypothetical protein
MGLSASGGGSPKIGHSEVEKLEKGIVLTDVIVKKREITIDVPKINIQEVTYEKPVIVSKEYEKPIIKEIIKETIKYQVKDVETIRFVPKDVECERPVIKDKEYERPVIKEQVYEKPIVEYKKIEVVSIEDVHLIKEYVTALKELRLLLPQLQEKLKEIKDYKLVEKVITVPKVEYVTVQAERIEWIPVKKEMPIAE